MRDKVKEMLEALQLPYNDKCINYIVNMYNEDYDKNGNFELTLQNLKWYWMDFVKYLMS